MCKDFELQSLQMHRHRTTYTSRWLGSSSFGRRTWNPQFLPALWGQCAHRTAITLQFFFVSQKARCVTAFGEISARVCSVAANYHFSYYFSDLSAGKYKTIIGCIWVCVSVHACGHKYLWFAHGLVNYIVLRKKTKCMLQLVYENWANVMQQ